jgi:hypothetical protein
VEQAPVLDEDEALADLAEDVDVVGLVRVERYQHEPLRGAQAPEELQHEADVPVLGDELRLVEQVDERPVRGRALQQEVRPGSAEPPELIGLMMMDGEPVALVVAHAVDILTRAADPASGRAVAARDELEQRRLARAVRAEYAHDGRLLAAPRGRARRSICGRTSASPAWRSSRLGCAASRGRGARRRLLSREARPAGCCSNPDSRPVG